MAEGTHMVTDVKPGPSTIVGRKVASLLLKKHPNTINLWIESGFLKATSPTRGTTYITIAAINEHLPPEAPVTSESLAAAETEAARICAEETKARAKRKPPPPKKRRKR